MVAATLKRQQRLPTRDDALRHGLAYLTKQQDEDGALRGDYDGPLFLTPGYVFARFAIGRPLEGTDAAPLIATLRHTQNADGGFGLHYGGTSYVFTTALSYVALRLLGVKAADADATRAREWLLSKGGAVQAPAWGKYWLAALGLYDWQGVHPVTPELWLAPKALPMHPSRWWCHARAVYLPVSYLYATRHRPAEQPILAALRKEIYTSDFSNIDWAAARDMCADSDRYVDGSPVLTGLNRALGVVDNVIPTALRRSALDAVIKQIEYGEENTEFLDIGPVSKAFNVVALHAAVPGSTLFERAAAGMEKYLRDQVKGRSMMAYCGSETWDTLYTALAVAESGQATQHPELVERAHRFISAEQYLSDPIHLREASRDSRRGGWGFATGNGWPVVDCTSLGLCAAIKLRGVVQQPIAETRLHLAVELLLDMQNADGGWGTYEKARASRWLEWLNPSEVFADIMLEHSQTELTASALSALTFASRHLMLGSRLDASVQRAVQRGSKLLLDLQREDGSFEGNWGICFTYGTYFGVLGLNAARPKHWHERVALAAAYLTKLQNADGGFGESYRSCRERYYVPHPDGSQAAMTAWAALALSATDVHGSRMARDRAIDWLLAAQLPDGDWPHTELTGVFNRTCMLNYRFYRNYFPLLALGAARRSTIVP